MREICLEYCQTSDHVTHNSCDTFSFTHEMKRVKKKPKTKLHEMSRDGVLQIFIIYTIHVYADYTFHLAIKL